MGGRAAVQRARRLDADIATIRVAPITDTGQAFVEWWAEFDVDAAHEAKLSELFGSGVFAGGLTGLRKHFGG